MANNNKSIWQIQECVKSYHNYMNEPEDSREHYIVVSMSQCTTRQTLAIICLINLIVIFWLMIKHFNSMKTFKQKIISKKTYIYTMMSVINFSKFIFKTLYIFRLIFRFDIQFFISPSESGINSGLFVHLLDIYLLHKLFHAKKSFQKY